MYKDVDFTESFILQVPVATEALIKFKKTETVAEFIARGGKVTKGPTNGILWSYQVGSTGKSDKTSKAIKSEGL